MIMKAVNRSIRSIPVQNVSDEEWAAWDRIQSADPHLASPYFRPEFTQAVASVRDDVEVGIIEQHEEPVGFFPFQRRRFQFGIPVGGRLSDFHGAIVADGVEWSAAELLSGCGLRAWDFDHLPTDQTAFAASGDGPLYSSYMDLSQGYDHYETERKQLGGNQLKQTLRKMRKLEREFERVEFAWQSADAAQLQQMMEWKSQQYRRTGIADVFSFDWTRALLELLHRTEGPQFAGMLSTLSVNDRVVAVHFGIRSRDTLHYWFPAYDVEFEKFSPGLQLLLRMAQSAEEHGIKRIDLGEGVEQFKLSMKTGATEITRGSVELNNFVRTVRRSWRSTRNWMKQSPLGAPARLSAKVVRPLKDWLAFH